ncbi:MAG: hypothetical protein FWD26_00765 [Treponema sp.]|nr:hypothetical protein [Treponema sp.]
MKQNKFLFLAIIITMLVFSACEDGVGLGARLVLEGPVVSINSPSALEGQQDITVSNVFALSGSITSDSRIGILEISMVYFDRLEGVLPAEREWRWNNSWQYRELVDAYNNIYSSWQPYTIDVYESYIDPDASVYINPPIWQVLSGTVNWNLPVLMIDNPTSRDYFITISAADVTGRRDANSTQKLKVTYDNNEPNLIVLKPQLYRGSQSGEWYRLHPGYPLTENEEVIFNTWIYDPVNRPDETFSFINNWVTGPIDFEWEIDKEIIGSFYLNLEFTSRHYIRYPYHSSNGDQKIIYFDYQWDETGVGGSLPKRGTFKDGPEPIGANVGLFTKIRDAVTYEDLIVRDDERNPIDGAEVSKDSYTPMQVISMVEDGAGNMSHRSNGWFAYFPRADKPWARIDFGRKFAYDDEEIPLNAPELKYIWTNESINTNAAYDNDGVDSLEWTLYKLIEGTLDVDTGSGPWTGSVTDSGFLFSVDKRSRPWAFKAEGEYGVGRFKIVVTVKDIKGLESEPQIAFFTIESNTTPTVKTISSPSDTATLWGNNKGDFDVRGIAQVLGTGGVSVDRVSIAWIKPHPDPDVFAARELLYTDRSYANWDRAISPGAAGFFDSNDSRVWEIPLANITNMGVNSESELTEYEFYLTLNLFEHLNIGPDQYPHSDQVFFVRVLSNVGGERVRSSVKSFGSLGDLEKPVLTIERIIITDNNTSKTYTNNSGFGMISLIDAGDKMRVEGTWNDDSWSKWDGIDSAERLKFFKDFKVSWKGQGGDSFEFEIGGALSADGTWLSDEYTFEQRNTDAFISLSMGLTDLNDKNNETVSEMLLIETEMPTLIRISSEVSDGFYGEFKNTYPLQPGSRFIEIFLGFNIPVKFFENEGLPHYWPPDPLEAPYLLLNNGGRAYYYDGNGTNRLIFRYFIDGVANPSNMPTVPSDVLDYKGDSTFPQRLHVEDIVWTARYPASGLTSIIEDSTTQAVIHRDAFDNEKDMSLAGGKNIVIDKIFPEVTSVTTAVSVTRPYGEDSRINITVTFSEPVTVSGATTGTRAEPGNFYLNLAGGNLSARSAKALFANTAGQSSVSFVYEVEDGDNTSGFAGAENFLRVSSIEMGAGLSIKDRAENEIVKPVSVPPGGLGRNVIIDTVPPAAPTVTGTDILANNYEARSFWISGLENQNVRVEYHLDYNPVSPPTTGWITAPSTGRTQVGGIWRTAEIELDRTGVYNIAARQFDNAVPENMSAVSAVPLLVSIDRNPILTRFGSAMPDGIYGFITGTPGQVITIDIHFRIPLNLNTAAGSPYLVLNVLNAGANNNRALLQAGQTGARQVWTFTYTIPNTQTNVARLDVTQFVLNNAVFTDTAGVNVNTYITNLTNLASNSFTNQKNIVIQAGFPEPTNVNMGSGIVYANNELRITFNRDISAGDTENQLVIKQVATGYRIPAVMEEALWNAIFVNRTDIWDAVGSWPAVTVPAWGADNAARAQFWQELGEFLYQKGSNGARVGTGNELISDTSVKYVLKFDVDTAAADGSVAGLPPNVNMGQVRNAMRSAEALRFNARDREVSISANRTLVISLSGGKSLPVMGARYQWNFPNGFVKDVLEKPNGQSNTGSDTALTSGNPETAGNDTNPRVLTLSGNEVPVIRINKGEDIETITGTGENRQAIQPLTTMVRIDGRTPATTFEYRTRQTTDNVGRLIFRNGQTLAGTYQNDTGGAGTAFSFADGIIPASDTGGNDGSRNGIAPWGLPNVGNQHPTNQTSYDQAKNRPQSGNATTNHPAPGLNYWQPMGGWPGTYTTYASPFNIGLENYNQGGMIIHIHARLVQANAVQAYEAAYRSVFVFNNAAINNNGELTSATTDTVVKLLNIGYGWSSMTSILPNYQYGRMWIRGGDTIGGDSSVPDFPIARDRSLSRKARLMTPIDVSGITYNSNANASAATITNAQIPAVYRQVTPNAGANENRNYPGAYLWFWVTWKINVNAYIDHFAGELPVDDAAPQVPMNYKELYKGIMPSKEHYPVIPGRTTVFETRRVYRVRFGGQGGQLDFGPLSNSPRPSDLTPGELAQLGW